MMFQTLVLFLTVSRSSLACMLTELPKQPDPNESDSHFVCKCGMKKPSSIYVHAGGIGQANFNEFPWQVSLRSFDDGHFCGGSILNSKYILTAAHCTRGKTPYDFEVMLGENTIEGWYDNGEKFAFPDSIIEHPEYDPITLSYDFAIVKLSYPIDFSRHMSPACLPTDDFEIYSGTVGVATGWIKMNMFSDERVQVLHKIDMEVRSPQECMLDRNMKTVMSNRYYYPDGKDNDDMICAGSQARDICQGDGGAPLVVEENGGWTLIGVHSRVVGQEQLSCNHVFARVTSVLDWIKSNIADGTFCPAP